MILLLCFLLAPVRIEVNAGCCGRADKPVEVEGLRDIGHVEEVDAARRVMDRAVPFQTGETGLTLIMKGRTAAGAVRRFVAHPGKPASRKPLVTVEDDVEHEGQKSLRITTPAAVYTYHKEGAGFASLRDREGLEWIGYKPGGGAAGEYRGIPNLGKFAHPGYTGETGSATRVAEQGPIKVRIHSERHDGAWAAVWDIFPDYARMTLLRNGGPYWFLYEGTPAGRMSLEEGFHFTSDGRRRAASERWAQELPAPEWIYFGDSAAPRVLFLAKHEDDDAMDQYWPMQGSMTVFGFGRQFTCCKQYLTAAPARFTFGFAETAAFEPVKAVIENASRDVNVTVTR